MKTKIDKLNNSKIPIIVSDKELEKLQDKVLFPEKLEKANKILAKIGLPKKGDENWLQQVPNTISSLRNGHGV